MDSSSILIEPSDLDAALAKGAILIDARKPGDFKNGHIPGAVPFTSYDVFMRNTSLEGMKAFSAEMSIRFSCTGVKSDRPVIIYDENTGMRAARELWILEYLGHKKARMLHGGLQHWIAAGGPVIVDTDVPTVRPQKLNLFVASGCLANADEVVRRAGAWNFALLDVRNDAEWSGKAATACCARNGHIPRSVHIEWTQFLEDGRFKSPEAILALLDKHGINPRHDIVPYSHFGGRSANTYYALRHAGCVGARNYIGSWHEWSARSDLPIAA